jgi:hypothetical protein
MICFQHAHYPLEIGGMCWSLNLTEVQGKWRGDEGDQVHVAWRKRFERTKRRQVVKFVIGGRCCDWWHAFR